MEHLGGRVAPEKAYTEGEVIRGSRKSVGTYPFPITEICLAKMPVLTKKQFRVQLS